MMTLHINNNRYLSSTTIMKSYGLVIDESLQPAKPFQTPHQTPQNPHFPKRLHLDQNTESYSTVVEQAITTKDRPLLKEIIADSDQKIRKNTLASIATEKVPVLLSLLEQFLYEDSRNTNHYCSWLRELLKQHLGLILSAPDNRPTIARMLKFIEKKAEERTALLQMRARLQAQGQITKSKDFQPKFSYIQSQEKEKEENNDVQIDMGQMDEEDLDLDDGMLDQFDE